MVSDRKPGLPTHEQVRARNLELWRYSGGALVGFAFLSVGPVGDDTIAMRTPGESWTSVLPPWALLATWTPCTRDGDPVGLVEQLDAALTQLELSEVSTREIAEQAARAIRERDEARRALDELAFEVGQALAMPCIDFAAGETVEPREHAIWHTVRDLIASRDEVRAQLEKAREGHLRRWEEFKAQFADALEREEWKAAAKHHQDEVAEREEELEDAAEAIAGLREDLAARDAEIEWLKNQREEDARTSWSEIERLNAAHRSAVAEADALRSLLSQRDAEIEREQTEHMATIEAYEGQAVIRGAFADRDRARTAAEKAVEEASRYRARIEELEAQLAEVSNRRDVAVQ